MISSGVPDLDRMLGGGCDRGVSTLLLGPAGSGKSTIAAQFAVAAAARGEKAVIYSFEESPRTLYKRTEALRMDLLRHVQEENVKVQHIDPAEMTPGEFINQVRQDISSEEVSVVVIDSLNGYFNAMPEERFLMLQLHELFAFLGQKGITCFLVMSQHGMLGNMTNPLDVSYLADTVLLFRLYEQEGHLKQALSVVKRRGGAHDRTIHELSFKSGVGVEISKPLSGLRGILTGVPENLMTLRDEPA